MTHICTFLTDGRASGSLRTLADDDDQSTTRHPVERQRRKRRGALAPKTLTNLVSQATGRPVMHTERWGKISVTVLERHAGYLDVMSVLMRMKYHKAVSRAELIRALIEFMEQSRIDFTRFANAQEMVEFLIGYFRTNPSRCNSHLPLLLNSTLFHPERTSEVESTEEEVRKSEAIDNVNA